MSTRMWTPKNWVCCLWALLLSMTGACTLLQPDVESGAVLFQDDFSRPISGWDRYEDDQFVSDYVDGGYHIAVYASNREAWARPGLELGDVRIEVLAKKRQGPDDNLFGILCRYQDARNFYFLVVSSDGYSGIGVHRQDQERLLSSDTMLPSIAVRRGEASNHLRADCTGQQLTLYVNGALVAQTFVDENWPIGDVGLIVGTYAHPGVDVLFDNFSVLQP